MDTRDYRTMSPEEKMQLAMGLLYKLDSRKIPQRSLTTGVEPLSRAELQLLAASASAASMKIATSHPVSPNSST